MDASGIVQKVEVRTAYLPTIEAGGEGGASSDWLVRLLKPEVVVTIAGAPVSYAPEGSPGPTAWPTVRWVLVAVVGLAVLGALGLFRWK
jgi:hypothetical protein